MCGACTGDRVDAGWTTAGTAGPWYACPREVGP